MDGSEINSWGEILDIPPEAAQRIQESYSSLAMLARANPNEVAESTQINSHFSRKAVLAAQDHLHLTSPILANKLLLQSEGLPRISMGSQELDELLGGGLPTKAITDFYGASTSGKTQIAFQLCINVQKPEGDGGLAGCAYYIDTEGAFSPRRIAEIARYEGLNSTEVLSNIFVMRVYNVPHQFAMTECMGGFLQAKNVRLIVIDTLGVHFQREFSGSNKNVSMRHELLLRYIEILRRLAEAYDLSVMVTNHITEPLDDFFHTKPFQHALGPRWGHLPTHRVLLRKSKGTKRIARLVGSAELPSRPERVFCIDKEGICDDMDHLVLRTRNLEKGGFDD